GRRRRARADRQAVGRQRAGRRAAQVHPGAGGPSGRPGHERHPEIHGRFQPGHAKPGQAGAGQCGGRRARRAGPDRDRADLARAAPGPGGPARGHFPTGGQPGRLSAGPRQTTGVHAMISVIARRLALGAILGGAALLTACSVLPAPESLTYYQLPAAALAAQPSDPARQALLLQVDRPCADRALASPRIIVLPDGNQLSAYQGVRWSDDAPTLLRNRLAGALRDAGQFRAVALDSDALVADWELSGSLSAFQVAYV